MTIYALDGKRPTLAEDGSTWIAPTADVIGDVTFAANTSVWFGTVIRGDNDPITVGEGTNIQDNSVLHTDVGAPMNVGKRVIIGHKVMLHGCDIGDGTLIGIGSIILNGAKIGKNCLIGANSLIAEGKVIPDNSMVVGSPGRIIRQIDSAMEEFLAMNAQVYVDNAIRFRDGLEVVED